MKQALMEFLVFVVFASAFIVAVVIGACQLFRPHTSDTAVFDGWALALTFTGMIISGLLVFYQDSGD